MCKKEGNGQKIVGPKLGNKKSVKGAFFVCLFIRHSGIAQKYFLAEIFWPYFAVENDGFMDFLGVLGGVEDI
jgi:hypothetical protein